jgi:hypothetical protein
MNSHCSRFHALIVISMLVLAGCSGRQVYQSAAGRRQNECQKIMEDSERARCMEEANKDYDTYSKQRNASPEQR